MKLRSPRTALAVGAAILVAVIGTTLAVLGASEERPDRGPVIARVDGTPIHLAEARSRAQSVAAVHQDAGPLGDEWAERVLASLVDDVIIRTEASGLEVEPTDEDIETAVRDVRENFGSEGEWEEWLVGRGMDETEFRRRVTLNLLASHVYQAVTADVSVSSQQIRAYYREHRAEYEQGDRTLPLFEVRRDIRELLLDQERQGAFASWLEERRQAVDVVVVMDDWWERI